MACNGMAFIWCVFFCRCESTRKSTPKYKGRKREINIIRILQGCQYWEIHMYIYIYIFVPIYEPLYTFMLYYVCLAFGCPLCPLRCSLMFRLFTTGTLRRYIYLRSKWPRPHRIGPGQTRIQWGATCTRHPTRPTQRDRYGHPLWPCVQMVYGCVCITYAFVQWLQLRWVRYVKIAWIWSIYAKCKRVYVGVTGSFFVCRPGGKSEPACLRKKIFIICLDVYWLAYKIPHKWHDESQFLDFSDYKVGLRSFRNDFGLNLKVRYWSRSYNYFPIIQRNAKQLSAYNTGQS